ncbi:ubinuclein-1-like isoform X3 [Penaeus japonicus]|uniref:ubinuclein-1-like isoform X3 n=1 Tax=Penaeus japonicus TaxID=27405 RepID=UPI001C7129EF|nr:ubinuclein-1-like isoform X3 [Penaeus japonicus]
MTEPKKVAFSTLGPIKKEKKREKKLKTVRIILTLPESNEKSCPEFNYRELVSLKLNDRIGKKNLGDVINGPPLDPSDPFASDEDAALRALARQFENRYGGYIPNKKKKRRKENDFSTLGEGYDETDPFIDNSDAFDEVMPVHMETKERGFYINSGELDFEEVEEGEESSSSSSEGEDSAESETEVKKKKKMNRIDSDEEEQEEEEEESKKRKLHENGIIRPKKRKLDEGELLRKRKKMIGRFNAKNLEKKDSDPETEKVVNGCEKKEETQPNEQSIAASIEAVISKAREEAGEKKVESQESGSSGSDSSSSDSDSSGSSSSSDSDSDEEEEEEGGEDDKGTEGDEGEGEEGMEMQDAENGLQLSDSEDNIRLPDNLPTDLLQVINRLKEEGHSCKGSSQKFFTDAVNKLLLSIEIKLNKLGGRKKTQIYNHLSQHLPCGTQTIVKRAKNLLAERQENRLREPLQRLKEAVDSHMPLMMEQHALECQKAAESNPQQYWELYYHFWGENGTVQNEDDETQDGDKKKSRLPKKKFLFTESIKKHLCEVVSVRVKFWQMMKKRSETPEDHIRMFLDAEVRPLWPKGWMNARILYKESTEAHSVITDKSNIRTTPAKKMVTLGGGSTSITPTTPTPQPPKPSLSATAVPKALSPAVSSACKSEVVKKKVPPVEQKPSSVSKPLVEGTVTGSGGLSIKSVEKINEEVPKKTSSPEISTQKISDDESATKINTIKPPVKKSSTSFNVIDLSSDEDKSMNSKVESSKAIQMAKSKETEAAQSNKKEVLATISSTTSLSPSVTSLADFKKEDNLEEEMNLVMNELLQISKQKSVDEPVETLSPHATKESHVSTAVIVTSKPQNPYQTQVQETSHQQNVQQSPVQHKHQLHNSASKQEKDKPVEVPHQKQQNSPVQQRSSPIQLTSPVQQQQVQPPQLSPVQKQQPSPTQKQQPSSMQKQQPPSTQKQQSSPAQKQLSSPAQKQLSSPAQKQLSSPAQKQLSSPAQKPLSSPAQKPLSSPAQKPLSSPAQKPLSSPAQKPLSSPAQKQLSSPAQKQLSSPAQKQLSTSTQKQLSSSTQKQLSSSTQKQLSSSVQKQQSSSAQKQQANCSMQQHSSSHQQQSMQHSQPVNLQQSTAQHSLSSHQNKQPQHTSHPQHQKSQTQDQQQQSVKQESGHHKSQSQQYSMSHHQQSLGSSSWNKHDMSLPAKNSSSSTNKTLSSWASGHEVNPARQRQTEALPIVSSSDPLANLRMMHGLSVSSVTKKSSSSSSVYHSPAALAASSTASYSLAGTKKSSGSSSSNAMPSISSNTSSHSRPVSVTTTNSSNYSSSQAKHSTSSHSYSPQASKHTATPPKPSKRLDPYTASVSQTIYSSISQDQQLKAYKQQLQQHQQSNHHASQQQQDLWQQVSASSYLSGMSGMSNTEVLKLMSQIGKPMDSYTSSSQPGLYPPMGTPTSEHPHHSLFGGASGGASQPHHLSPHHLHPTHGGSGQHHGKY